jgi:hypothetical protein
MVGGRGLSMRVRELCRREGGGGQGAGEGSIKVFSETVETSVYIIVGGAWDV